MTNWEQYCAWLKQRNIDGIRFPDEHGLFHNGDLVCILPLLRVYWKGSDPKGEPLGSGGAWDKLGGDQWTRFFRADQILDWLAQFHSPTDDVDDFKSALRKALKVWLIPIEFPLADRPHIFACRVEAIRVFVGQKEQGDNGSAEHYLHWTRRPDLFPDRLRRTVAGFDPVHTPENARAGLTRYLAQGWEIDDTGALVPTGGTTVWGPSTSRIPYRLHNAPRRLMLGTSLQARAVPLLELDRPVGAAEGSDGWYPPGRNLRVVFSALSGWTHEDAIVVSRSAAEKLTSEFVVAKRLLIPAVAYYKLEVQTRGDKVQRGQPMVRVYIDLYALGWRKHEAEALNASDGCLEITVPDAQSPMDGELTEDVEIRTLRTPKWRASLVFKIRGIVPLGVGDKLATRHGIKGVVSQIREDEEMPEHPDGKAEIVLSRVGVVRRGAMGQFWEAASGNTMDRLPRVGMSFVMRQPQDALPRCRARGPGADKIRGQRYGEMEFWALMAHGASKIAQELLSLKRSTSSRVNNSFHSPSVLQPWTWMAAEEEISSARDHRTLATHALNRYMGLLGAKFENGVLQSPKPNGHAFSVAFDGPGRACVINAGSQTELRELSAHLEDSDWFILKGGIVILNLGREVELELVGHVDRQHSQREKRTVKLVFSGFGILPPWFRPAGEWQPHPLTKQYRKLLSSAAAFAWAGKAEQPLELVIESCLRAAFHEKSGAAGFLRRQILGRCLTRSARAVIVPNPSLRIDQILIPRNIFAKLFDGLPAQNRQLVLVNRNPTLHRRGLLALRPVIDEGNHPVFGLPLGVLRVMGADFDGDQVSVVAVETQGALEEGARLLPGAEGLRTDPFRENRPAFPLLRELSAADEEWEAARTTDVAQEEWCLLHQRLLQRLLMETADGWSSAQEGSHEHGILWKGMPEEEWLKRAQEEMEKVYNVRQKGQRGGLLRRQLYRRSFKSEAAFCDSVAAIQAVTERVTQEALSVKTHQSSVEMSGEERKADRPRFDPRAFFADPAAAKSCLAALDDQTLGPLDAEAICAKLGPALEPTGLMAWLARPTLETVVDLLADPSVNQQPGCYSTDPRIAWFLA